jgi:predicted transcriptional regulator
MPDKPKPVWVSFRVEPELVKRIDELAAAEHRTRANWLQYRLAQIATQEAPQVWHEF